MPSENVERVRSGHTAFNRGDIDGTAEHWHADIVWRPSGAFADVGEAIHGRSATADFMRSFRGLWADLRLETNRIEAVDESRVLSLGTFHARGRDGVEVQRPVGYVYSFREGQCVEAAAYASWEEALEAVGLPE